MNIDLNILKNSNNDSISDFTFKGIFTICKIVDIYDADTFRIIFFRNNELIKIKVRALGYNSAELRPSLQLENREEEIKQAILAKNRLLQLVTNISFDINKMNFSLFISHN